MNRKSFVLLIVFVVIITLCSIITLGYAINTPAPRPSLKLTAPAEEVARGRSIKIDYEIVGAGAQSLGSPTKKIWTSSDKNVLEVEKGTVTGKKLGTAIISLELIFDDGNTLKADISLSVYQPTYSLEFKKNSIKMNAGEQATLAVAVSPIDAKYQNVTWSSSDPSIAVVDENGVVTAKKGGKVTITATSSEPIVGSNKPKSASCSITIAQLVSKVTLDKNNISVAKGQSQRLNAQVTPNTATNKQVKWTSEDKSIATVDSNGNVRGVKVGTTNIYCTAVDGSDVSTSCRVIVIQGVTSITASKTRCVINQGQNTQIYITVKPAEATNKVILWESDSPYIATVSTTGVITGQHGGETTIHATTTDGTKKTVSIKVIVEPSNPISLESIGFGVYNNNLLGLTVKNLCNTRRIVDIGFDITMYDYGGRIVNEGSFSLGKKVSIPAKQKQTIKRNLFGVGQAYRVVITITDVMFADTDKWWHIQKEYQETWSFSR